MAAGECHAGAPDLLAKVVLVMLTYKKRDCERVTIVGLFVGLQLLRAI